jgi:oligopeptide/dipeptide ABC transporter ATP-binding protein
VLLNSIPVPDPEHEPVAVDLAGELPSPVNPPAGCRFHTRCAYAGDVCGVEEPKMRQVIGHGAGDHYVACHFPLVEAVPVTVG